MNDKVLYKISIEQLLQQNIGRGLDTDILISPNLQEYASLFSFPLRIDAIVFMICLKGRVGISINLKEWTVGENMYIISLPENTIGLNYISEDFEGYTIIVSMEYLRNISLNLKDVMPYYGFVRLQPCFQIASANVKIVSKYFELFELILDTDGYTRKQEIIKGLTISLFNKLAEDLDEVGIRTIIMKTKSKEYYFMNFTEQLLQNFREEHGVGFYAHKLGLTPKYLSALIKEISGISASQWINNYLVLEARTLLRFTDLNVLQIADYLNFPNQSFFSKYFKRHVGTTPKQYRDAKED